MFDTRGMALAVHSFDPDECGSADFAEPTTPVAPPAPVAVPDPAEGYREGLARLRSLAEQVRPTTLGVEQVIPVDATLADLFPRGGIARGSVVGVTGPGAVSLTATLVAAASHTGSWVAWVSCGDIGWAAIAEMGVALERVVAVPDVPTGQWATVVAALLDAIDVVVVSPTHQVRAVDARRLAARARERGSVVTAMAPRHRWPTEYDVALRCEGERWDGLGNGHGRLRSRQVRVTRSGRRSAAQERGAELWLPAANAG